VTTLDEVLAEVVQEAVEGMKGTLSARAAGRSHSPSRTSKRRMTGS
jgi:hypothetical protein